MAEVKWIKLTTDMFDNRKIKHLRKLPEGNNIVLIWVMLLTMAGRCNANGMIFLTENIPYTPKMLADELDFEENTIKLALEALERFGMIITQEGFFAIAGWEEHQNSEGMDRIREQTRQRVAKHREKQKILLDSVTCNVTVTQGNAIDIDKDIDKDIDIDKNIIMPDSDESGKPTPKKSKPVKHKYGEYNNVLLTDDELSKLKTEFSDCEERIERLSSYIASTGKAYKSHYATIRNWARKDKEKQPEKPARPSNNRFNNFEQRNNDFEAMVMDRFKEKRNNPPKTAADDPALAARVEAMRKRLG